MTRTEIREVFRTENPEITSNVISDALLNTWCEIGDKEICASTRCIVSEATLTSVATTTVASTKYDLTNLISKFYDIDEYPGGGVMFDGDPLKKTSIAELNYQNPTWQSRSAGTPKKWYRRGKWLYFDRPVETADLDIIVYCVLISDDFNDDNITPYNQLTYLEPFHYGIVKYLQWKAKAKVGKREDAQKAQQEYLDYINWMRKQIGGNKYVPIYYEPKV